MLSRDSLHRDAMNLKDTGKSHFSAGVLNLVLNPVVVKFTLVGFISLCATVMLFTRLGHYALWDDEAITALHAIGVWNTGDTSAIIGHNIVAYRGGALIRDMRERHTPPFASYIAAVPLGLHRTALVARLPFAFCGLATIVFLLWWAWSDKADLLTWCLLGLAILGNVSLFLYLRQCRYYAPAILLSAVVSHAYLHWKPCTRNLMIASFVLALLFTTHYMNYAALCACLLVDHFAWDRKLRPLKPSNWAWLLIPQLVLCAPVACIWNPIDKRTVDYESLNWYADKATLLWWNCRDLSRCEFGAGFLILAAPGLAWLVGNRMLARACTALFVYILVVTLVSPQPVGMTNIADVRYLSPLIPLCIAIGVLSLRIVGQASRVGALMLALIFFDTSLLPWSRPWTGNQWSTLIEYIHELRDPPDEPYTVTANWINSNVLEGQSIWVQPAYMTYPLMFHAPKAIYAWQLDHRASRRLVGLAAINYFGREEPDYIISFGPALDDLRGLWTKYLSKQYRLFTTLDVLGQDLYRPELLLRTFRPIPLSAIDRRREAIFIFIHNRIKPAGSRGGGPPNANRVAPPT